MTRGRLVMGAFVTLLAAGALPAQAQNGKAGTADREIPEGATRIGTATPRDGGGSAPSPSGSSAGETVSSSPMSTPRSAPYAPSSPYNSPGGGREYVVAPTHPAERQQSRQRGGGEGGRRTPSGGGSGERAVPRDSSGGGSADSSSSGASTAGRDGSSAPSRVESSRPRDGRPVTGRAVPRQFPRVDPDDYPYYAYRSPYFGYYSPARRYYSPAYGFGLGFLYDPLWYDPFFYGGYDPYGYGYGGGAYGGYYGGSGSSGYARGETGNLRLKIKPREAQVFVDGFFVGSVDDFDGLFQKLGIDAGTHRIEIKAEGFEPIEFDVLLTPGETVTYKGELKQK